MKTKFMTMAFAVVAMANLFVSFAGNVYYWCGGTGWADYTDLSNWEMTKGEGDHPEALPGEGDFLWSGGFSKNSNLNIGFFDLKGTSQTIAGWTEGVDSGITTWKNYCIELTNGTFTVLNPTYSANGEKNGCRTGRLFTIWDGATLIYPKATYTACFFPSGLDEQWKIKRGGRVEVYCSTGVNSTSEHKDTSSVKPTCFAVDEGGTLIFDPVDFWVSTVNRKGFEFVNNGVMRFPHGLVESKACTYAGDSGYNKTDKITVMQQSGTMLMGGDFAKTARNTSVPGEMRFVLAGGTLEVTNSVRFFTAPKAYDESKGWGEQVFAEMPEDKSATVDVKAGSRIDMSNFTFGDNTSLEKTGAGTLVIGENRPTSLHVAAGFIGFAGEVDLTNISLDEGTGLSFDRPGMVVDGAIVGQFSSFTFGNVFAEGETIVTADTADTAAAIASRMSFSPLYAGFGVRVEGTCVVLYVQDAGAVDAHTYFWKGEAGADAWDMDNWRWSQDGLTMASRPPCSVDPLYGFVNATYDLTGHELKFGNFGLVPSGTSATYLLAVTNGTLVMSALNMTSSNPLLFWKVEVQDGGRFVADGTQKFIAGRGRGTGFNTTWTVRCGGRMDIVLGDKTYNRMKPATAASDEWDMLFWTLDVEAGGVCYFDPAKICLQNGSNDSPSTFRNAGTFIAPHGIIWNGFDPWTNAGYTKRLIIEQNAGTMYLGGNVTKVIEEKSLNQPASMQFVFAGGTIVTSNSVGFLKGVLSQGAYEVEAAMTGSGTVETAEGSSADFDIMTYGEGVALTKTGPGQLRLVNLPPTLDVRSGTVAFANAVTDFSHLTFADGTVIRFDAKGNDLSALANPDKLTYTLGEGFVPGDGVAVADTVEKAQTIARRLTMPDYLEGYQAVVDGTTVVLRGALVVKPRNVTVCVGDDPVDHGFTINGYGLETDVWTLVKGTPTYDFGGYQAGSPAGTYEIRISGLTDVDGSPVTALTATLTVVAPTVSETFYWRGDKSAWADFGLLDNWAMSADGQVPATRLPGRKDLLWGLDAAPSGTSGTVGRMDLVGQTYVVSNLSQTGVAYGDIKCTLYVRNGTLRIAEAYRLRGNISNATVFEALEGGNIEINSTVISQFGSSRGGFKDWIVRSGGRMALTGDYVNERALRFFVEAGGEFLYDIAGFCMNNSVTTAEAFSIDNAGTFIAPRGIIWTGQDPYSNSGVVKTWIVTQKPGATMYLGGDFTKSAPESTEGQPGSMQFVFAGGTIVASNEVAFCNRVQSFGTDEVSARMTGDGTVVVAENASLGFDVMTYADGVTLTKQGPGLFRLGADLPPQLVATAGSVGFAAPLTDVSSMTFADGVTLVLGAKDNSFAPPDNYARLGFALETANFVAGDAVLRSDDAGFRTYVADQIAATVPDGMRATVNGDAIVIVPDGDNVFEADGEFDLNDETKWRGGSVPVGQDVTVYGAGTVARIDGSTKRFASICVSGGATLKVTGAAVALPATTLESPSALTVADGASATLLNGFATTGGVDGLPVLTVETNALLQVAGGTVFKNVDLRHYGTIRVDADTGSGTQVTFGGAAAGETAYFAMSTVGGTFEFFGCEDAGNYDTTSRRFVSPTSGGRVVVVGGRIVLKDAKFTVKSGPNRDGRYAGIFIGVYNPTDEEFEFVFDHTDLAMSRCNAYSGGAKIRLTNGSRVATATYHPGVSTFLECSGLATVTVEGEGTVYRLENADPFKYQFYPNRSMTTLIVRDGARFAAHNTKSPEKRSIAEIADGIVEIPNLPYIPTDLNPHPADNDPRNWLSDLFNGFRSVNVPDGKTLRFESVDVLGYTGGSAEKNWNRNVKFANIPITGAGDVTLANATPGYSVALTLVASNNTCTGTIGVDRNAQDPTTLLFADGANWAGTVVGGKGVSCTNLVDAAAPAEVSFAALELTGTMPIRVWGDGTSDMINIGSALTGNGRFEPVFMDGRPKTGVTFTIGRYPASAGVPDAKFAKRGCTFSVEPIDGTDDVWLKMTYVPQGTLLLVR